MREGLHMENNLDRIRDQRLKDRVVTPEEALPGFKVE